MIIKSKDNPRPAAGLREPPPGKSPSKKQRETRRLASPGANGESEAAHLIDRQIGDSRHWAVIHDLRLEHNGRLARIDHLLISRFFDIFVIASGHCSTPIRLDAGGDFQLRAGSAWKPMPSPIEQNKRQIIVLNELINDQKLTPTRLGLPIKPAYRNWVLVSRECHISRRHMEEAIILKMDTFDCRLRELIAAPAIADDILSIAKTSSTHTIMEFARRLVTFHRPASCEHPARNGHSLTGHAAAPARHLPQSTGTRAA